MTDDPGQTPWFALSAPSAAPGVSPLEAVSPHTATFKARVQGSGRVSIPKSERDALGIEEGDIVQTIVVPTTHDHP